MFMRRFLSCSLSFLMLSACLTDGGEEKPSLGHNSSALNLARSTKEAGDGKAAVSILMQQVQAKSKNPAIYVTLSDMLLEQGKVRQAIEVLEKGNQNVPKDALIHRKLGNAYLVDNQSQKAEVVFNQGLEFAKNDSGLLGGKGIALDMQGKTQAAREMYEAAIKASGDNVTAANNLAMSYLLGGEYAKASEVLEGAAFKTTATPQIRQNLAFSYVLLGEDEKAMKVGLQDYSEKDMEKNIAYYRSVAEAVKTGKMSAAKVTGVEVKDTAVNAPAVKAPARLPEPKPAELSKAKKIPLIPSQAADEMAAVPEDDKDEQQLRAAVPAAGNVKPQAAASPASAPAAAVKAEGKKWYIDLGNFASSQDVRAHWDGLKKKVGPLPDDAFTTMKQSDGREKLLIGPYAGFGDFKGVCDTLKKGKVACSVVQLGK